MYLMKEEVLSGHRSHCVLEHVGIRSIMRRIDYKVGKHEFSQIQIHTRRYTHTCTHACAHTLEDLCCAVGKSTTDRRHGRSRESALGNHLKSGSSAGVPEEV